MTKCVIRTCRKEFVKRSMSHKACSPDCAAEFATQERLRKENREYRERKKALKRRSDWLKEAQSSFNAFIRERDRHQSCICCGLPLSNGQDQATGGAFDCGHYRSTGSAPHLRFDERNANGQRKQCNRWGAGRAVDYRLGLIARIGLAAVEDLEADQTQKHFTAEMLAGIKATYQMKLRQLKEERAAHDDQQP